MKPAQAFRVDVSVKLAVIIRTGIRSLLLLPQLDPSSTRGKLTTDHSISGCKCNGIWVDELPPELDSSLTAR